MTQAGIFDQPTEQLFRQALESAGQPEDRCLWRFAGICDEASLPAAAAAVKHAVSALPLRMQKHIFASFIELFQNVGRYGAPSSVTSMPSYGEIHIGLSKTEEGYIHAANLIPAQARARLEASLTELTKLDQASLSRRYREQLCQPCQKDKPSGAAGLGLIELVKRSGPGLRFSFLPVNESCYLFTISLNFKNI